jgi:hypothetical protein
VEREWLIDEEGIAYVADLALPAENGCLPVSFGDRPGPAGDLRFAPEEEPDVCVREIQARLGTAVNTSLRRLLSRDARILHQFPPAIERSFKTVHERSVAELPFLSERSAGTILEQRLCDPDIGV